MNRTIQAFLNYCQKFNISFDNGKENPAKTRSFYGTTIAKDEFIKKLKAGFLNNAEIVLFKGDFSVALKDGYFCADFKNKEAILTIISEVKGE